MGNPVSHFEVLGKEPAKLRSFYAQVFGWKMQDPEAEDPMDYAMVSTESEGGIEGGIGKAQHGDGSVTFYVSVDDLQETLDKATQAGGRMVMPPQQIAPTTAIALLADPEGHVIGLTKE